MDGVIYRAYAQFERVELGVAMKSMPPQLVNTYVRRTQAGAGSLCTRYHLRGRVGSVDAGPELVDQGHEVHMYKLGK